MENEDDAANTSCFRKLPVPDILPGNEWTPRISAIAGIAMSIF
jgi:hypothetical protein